MNFKKTVTSLFIVPLLKIPTDLLKENGFINGYACDKDQDIVYENSICLLFKPPDLLRFKEFLENEYDRTTNIIDDYDIAGGFVVLVYKLDMTYRKDYSLIKQGKYSKTSQRFQSEFKKLVNIKREGVTVSEFSLQYRVFNKTEDLFKFWEDLLGSKLEKDQEVWLDYEPEKEELTYEKLKEYV
jgi:hypothetical protein